MEDYVSPPFERVGVFRGRFIREGEAMPDPTNAELQAQIAITNQRIDALVASVQQGGSWWSGLETWLGNHPGIAHSLNALFSAATGFAIAYMTLHTPTQPQPTPQAQVKPDDALKAAETPKGSVRGGKGP